MPIDSDLPEAYYLPRGDGVFDATRATESPWDPDAQHGGPPSALLAHVMDAVDPRPDLRLGRITVEFLGVLPRVRVEVHARVARPGRRIRLLEATMRADGREIALARAWQIASRPEPDVPTPAGGPPASVPDVPPHEFFADQLGSWGYGRSIEWRLADGVRLGNGEATVWTRVRLPLVAGEPLHDVDRAVVIADSVNGVGAALPLDTWLFVPTAMTLTLHRYPLGEWVALDARTTLAADGVGSTLGILSDETGELGTVTQPLLVAPR